MDFDTPSSIVSFLVSFAIFATYFLIPMAVLIYAVVWVRRLIRYFEKS